MKMKKFKEILQNEINIEKNNSEFKELKKIFDKKICDVLNFNFNTYFESSLPIYTEDYKILKQDENWNILLVKWNIEGLENIFYYNYQEKNFLNPEVVAENKLINYILEKWKNEKDRDDNEVLINFNKLVKIHENIWSFSIDNEIFLYFTYIYLINNKLYILDFDNNWSEQIYEIKLDWKFIKVVDYEWDIYSGWVGHIIIDIKKNNKIYRNTYTKQLKSFALKESEIISTSNINK